MLKSTFLCVLAFGFGSSLLAEEIAQKTSVTSDWGWSTQSIDSYETIDLSSGNSDFTSGTIDVARVGNVVTISWGDLAINGSNWNPSTASTISSEFRISSGDRRNVFQMASAGLMSVQVNSDGTIDFFSRDWSGSSNSVTGINQGTISYVLD